MMYHDEDAKQDTEFYLAQHFAIDHAEPMPTRAVRGIQDAPLLYRYFCRVTPSSQETQLSEADYVVHTFMDINSGIDGAFVASAGKNMGAFKGVGFPEEIGDFYRLEEYEGQTWIGHDRFPTNTPGWWGGAHPFSLLDYSIVHNGEITQLRHQQPLSGAVRLQVHAAAPTPRSSPTCST